MRTWLSRDRRGLDAGKWGVGAFLFGIVSVLSAAALCGGIRFWWDSGILKMLIVCNCVVLGGTVALATAFLRTDEHR
jgi:hypothetical protein